jgi:hypothetical protein
MLQDRFPYDLTPWDIYGKMHKTMRELSKKHK